METVISMETGLHFPVIKILSYLGMPNCVVLAEHGIPLYQSVKVSVPFNWFLVKSRLSPTIDINNKTVKRKATLGFLIFLQNLPKFGNVGKSVTLIFLSRNKSDICVTWPLMVESRKEKKTKNGVARCHTIYIKYSIFVIVSSFLAWIWPEWLIHVF